MLLLDIMNSDGPLYVPMSGAVLSFKYQVKDTAEFIKPQNSKELFGKANNKMYTSSTSRNPSHLQYP